MEKIAFVTGADRGLGLALTAALFGKGYRVFSGQYMPEWPELDQLAARSAGRVISIPLDVASTESVQAAAKIVQASADHIDVLINSAGVSSPTSSIPISQAQDYPEMMRQINVNALGPIRVVEAFLPLVSASTARRLCFVSSEAGSIGASTRTAWFGYCMSKAALNMAIKNMFNDLHPQGYTFRVYHPGWIRSYMSGKKNMDATLEPEEAAEYALTYFLAGLEPGLAGVDEDRLVLRDYLGKEYPW